MYCKCREMSIPGGIKCISGRFRTMSRSPLLGMADIVVLDVLVILYLVRSANVRAAAAWLFVPYLCWILFATYLNAYILVANGTGL